MTKFVAFEERLDLAPFCSRLAWVSSRLCDLSLEENTEFDSLTKSQFVLNGRYRELSC